MSLMNQILNFEFWFSYIWVNFNCLICWHQDKEMGFLSLIWFLCFFYQGYILVLQEQNLFKQKAGPGKSYFAFKLKKQNFKLF